MTSLQARISFLRFGVVVCWVGLVGCTPGVAGVQVDEGRPDAGSNTSSGGAGTSGSAEAPSSAAAPSSARASSGQTGGSSAASSSSAASGTSSSSASASTSSPGNRMVLDPPTITLYELPIGSLRYGISGFAPGHNACVTLVYWGGVFPRCDALQMGDPYVIIQPNGTPPCDNWNYAGNVEVVAARGCVDVQAVSWPPTGMVDVELDVTGSFNGTVVANTRDRVTPRPITLGLRYVTDVPEDVFAQTADRSGNPTWVTLTRDGQPVAFLDDCAVPTCGSGEGVCGASIPTVRNITAQGFRGELFLTWDAREHLPGPGDNCTVSQPAPAGTYEARFCVGYQVDADGLVDASTCVTKAFTLEDRVVVAPFDFGG